jgi:thioredoxin reductase/SAM-dependent methyltransferase
MTNEQSETVDVAIIGGGAAGLAAALQLGRQRRRVVVLDGGAPLNAPAAHMHGYLGLDGLPPLDLQARGRDEVRGYGVTVVEGVDAVARRDEDGRLLVDVSDGTVLAARRVLLATGLTAELPEIPGVAAQWGRGVIHCPYCHGWEVRDRRVVVIATAAGGWHQALLFRQQTEHLTVVVHDGEVPEDQATGLRARGVDIVDGPVAAVEQDDAGTLTGVRLDDGTVVPADAVVVAVTMHPRVEPVAGLGIVAVADPMGRGDLVPTDPQGRTTVDDVYAAGSIVEPLQVAQAASSGALTGAFINMDLVLEDTARALGDPAGARRDDGHSPRAWDERYRTQEQLFSGRPNEALVTEIGGVEGASPLAPGSALDVGCGEGADVVWLAQQGWKVTGLDVSQVALERAAAATDRAGVDAEWIAGSVADAVGDRRFDLVTVHYPALRRDPDDRAIRALLDAVAPGGTLLAVWHAPMDDAFFAVRDVDPADVVLHADVAAALRAEPGWEVLVDEDRPRATSLDHAHFTHDGVLRARRR